MVATTMSAVLSSTSTIIITSLMATIIAVLAFWRLWFLRQPIRNIPQKGIVSPASGRVVNIINFEKGEARNINKGLFGRIKTLTREIAEEGYIVVIMMTPLDVHYQRAPITGTIEKIKYRKGKFRNAVLKSDKMRAIDNERNEIVINNGIHKLKVVQVAGAVARRINCFVSEGQKVRKGQTIGLINLGSQVLLVMPKRKLMISKGQKVTDGESIISV